MTQNVKAVLLVGGMGTRLRSILPATPKPMASVGRGSFLDLLVRQLQCQGICRLVMCTGHLADQIENEFEDGKAWGVTIEYSREPEALGTGGAIKLAERYLLDTRDFLVMNGDSFLEIDLHKFIRFHRAHDGLASIAVWKAEDTARFGTVHVTSGGRVTAFAEKTGASGPGLINAGVYAFNQAVFQYIPAGTASLERHVFPQMLAHGVYALEQPGMFIDIGTPEDYARAREQADRLYEVAAQQRESLSGEREKILARVEGSRESR